MDYKQHAYPDSKAHGASMGPIWGRQDPGGPHVGPKNFAIWVIMFIGLFWDISITYDFGGKYWITYRDDSKLAPIQWETSLQSSAVSPCLGANLESALCEYPS